MTKEECKNKKYLKKYRDIVIYKGRVYRILGVNTHDCLLDLVGSNLNHVDNVPCEDVDLLTSVDQPNNIWLWIAVSYIFFELASSAIFGN